MAAAGSWSRVHAGTRAVGRRLGRSSRIAAAASWLATARSWLAAGLALVVLMFPVVARAESVKGEATFSAGGGYARLIIKFAEEVGTEVTTAGTIIVIRFKRPVEIPVGRLAEAVSDYIGSVRRDPDGSAIRLSLTRRVTVNTMTAGERVFIDLLPDSWTGAPPGLPSEVVRELADRARIAERELRQLRAVSEAKKRPPIRVRASVQPTFVRFVFEMPDGVTASSVLSEQTLRLQFNAALVFELADAKLAAPSNVASITQKVEGETSAVEITMVGDVDVHSFREDRNYSIDVAFQQDEKPSALPSMSETPHVPAPVLPAVSTPAMPDKPSPDKTSSERASPDRTATDQAADVAVASPPAAEIAAPTPEALAGQAKIEINPEQPSQVTPAAAEVSSPVSPPKEPAATIAEVSPKMPLAAPAPEPNAGGSQASVRVKRDSDGLRLVFSFSSATPAALFRRADTVWLVFDSTETIDVEPIRGQSGAVIADASLMPLEKGQAIRFRLTRPQLPSLTGEDRPGATNWTVTFADAMLTSSQPLTVTRNIADPTLANVSVPLPKAGLLHRIVDPDAGDTVMVVTAMPPARGFIKRQDFVEMSLLESIHGVAIRPNSDEVTAEIASDKVILGKAGGLTLSPAETGADRASTVVRPIFDVVEWRKNQEGSFVARLDALIEAVAAAAPDQRTPGRIDLARFYLSRGLYAEAKGVLDLAVAEKPGAEDPAALIVHSVASTLMGRPELGLKDLASPAIGTNYDSQLWKAMVNARLGKFAEAPEKVKSVEFAITSLPIELQRLVIVDAMRASLEVRDYPGAAKRAAELEVIGPPPELKPAIAVLRGRLDEALGHDKDALDQYKRAVNSPDRAAAAEAKLLEVALKQRHGEISPPDVLRELETLAMTWRGDAFEVQTLEMLARIYADTGRYAESFGAVRIANRLSPNSQIARQGQDGAAALFTQLFLGPKGDDLPPIDALAMFYEYRELTPIGRRGDEMIRRLADRLVAVDLLDQASELLQYQIDKRLEGAARAQVAARLAMVYLTNRKPDRAIAALRSTRIADLSGELRQQRLLLEARAQSDIGRHDLALDLISNINGREAIRLRSDIHWAARHWRESSEQIELYYADRWRDFKPLNPVEKGDVIRAVVGYALADDAIGLARFREKYGPLMSGEADQTAFETASKPTGSGSADFAQIAKMAASVDTLDGFLRDMKTRFPDATARATVPPESPKADPFPTGSLPAIVGFKPVRAAK